MESEEQHLDSAQFLPSTSSQHIPGVPRMNNAVSSGNSTKWLEHGMLQGEEHTGTQSNASRFDYQHCPTFDEPECLVTADDVSSSMFTDDVLTAIEAPQQEEEIVLVCEAEELALGYELEEGRVRKICEWFENMHRLGRTQSQME
ncbi:hypothetical protein COOONC_12684 [Cooperia oncophora]